MSEPKFFGSNCKYFLGVVEENNDETSKDGNKVGRCRVRLMGVHSPSKVENDAAGEGNPSNKLHWAWIVQPTTSAAISGIGHSPTSLLNGTHVLVMSMDGNAVQDL